MTAIARQSARILETTLTPAALLARAIKRGRLPSRRYRVEDSSVGPSRILSSIQADLAQARYGGRKVELITAAMFLTAEAADRQWPPCPRKACGAPPGAPCRNKTGVRAPHDARLDIVFQRPSIVEEAQGLGACACGAAAGAPCQRAGKPRRPHKGRPPIGAPS